MSMATQLGAYRLDGMPQTHEQAVQGVATGLFDLVWIEVHVVDGEPFFGLQPLEIEAKRGDVPREIGSRLLEGDEHPRLAENSSAPDRKTRLRKIVFPEPALPHKKCRATLG